VRADAKVEEIALAVNRDHLVFRQVADDLGLVGLALAFEQADRLVAVPHLADQRLVALDDLAPGEKHHIQDTYDGFRSTVTRTVKDAKGHVIWKDTFHSSYRMLPGLTEIGRYKGDPPAGTRVLVDDYKPPK